MGALALPNIKAAHVAIDLGSYQVILEVSNAL